MRKGYHGLGSVPVGHNPLLLIPESGFPMLLPPLIDGFILRRYQRFLAEVQSLDGERWLAHCPNTGSMKSCWRPRAPVQISRATTPGRKLSWTLERIDMGAGWVGVHTGRVNAVVAEAMEQGIFQDLSSGGELVREVRVSLPPLPPARLDLLLRQADRPLLYMEVKNVTLLEGEALLFPDAVTLRGRKHLDILLGLHRLGHRARLVFALNRPEGSYFAPAWDIDSVYAARLREVALAGVEVVARRIAHEPEGMRMTEEVPVDLRPPG